MQKPIKDVSKLKLIKRVIEMEKRGWECIKPVEKINSFTQYETNDTLSFSDTFYVCVMENKGDRPE